VGEDLDGGGGAHGGGAGVWCEPRWRVHGWRGPRWRWRRNIEEEWSVRHQRGGGRSNVEEEWLVRHRRGGGQCGIEANAEEEWTPTGVWRGNDSRHG
jgi:hypothetical protein